MGHTSSPSSPKTSPTSSPSSLLIHASMPSLGALTTSSLALAFPFASLEVVSGCPAFLGVLFVEGELGISDPTSNNFFTRGNGEEGGKSLVILSWKASSGEAESATR